MCADNRLSIDWLSFTYKVNKSDMDSYLSLIHLFELEFPGLAEYMHNGDMVNITYGRSHYSAGLRLDTYFRVEWVDYDINDPDYLIKLDNQYRMGVHVSIPSHGLKKFFDCVGEQIEELDFSWLMNWLRDHHCILSRIDINYDDYDCVYTPMELFNLYHTGFIKTVMQRNSYDSSGLKDRGTFYLGSRKGGKMLRVYDKEYESNGEIKAIRWEIEYTKKFARALQDSWEKGDLDNGTFGDLINDMMVILEKSKFGRESNVSRIKASDRWLDFVNKSFANNFKGIHFAAPKPSVEKKAYWVKTYCARSIGIFVSLLQEDTESQLRFLRQCESKLTDFDRSLLRNFKNDFPNTDPLSWLDDF